MSSLRMKRSRMTEQKPGKPKITVVKGGKSETSNPPEKPTPPKDAA